MNRVILYFLILLSMFGCSNKEKFILFNKADINKTKKSTNTNNNIVEPAEFDDVEFEYKIVPYDRVLVIIYKHPELSPSTLGNRTSDRGILVNSRGDIRLPLIKSVHVAGLTQTQAQEVIEEKLRRYLKSPDVYFEVLNKRAYIVGEVNKPGEIPLENERTTLLQLIARAGDLRDTANRQAIMILRNNRGKISSEVVNLTDVNSLRTANLMIKPNDVVYVLPNDMKPFNVKIDEINPIFRLISNVLSPFITIKILSDY